MPSNKSECHDLETRDRTKVHGYEEWIRSIKERIQRARVKASMLVNSEQTLLYWDIGHDILEKQESEGWGAKVVERMSADLKAAFPDMTGLSPRNLKYMRAFADAWARKEIVQAPLAQLPWYHHLALLECLKSRGDRIAYAALAIENGWSRNVMVHQIELGVADLHGTAITNFKKLMPPADSDMAEQTLRGEYDLSRNDVVAEYSLADLNKPIGVSTYRLGLPPIEQLQAQLRKALTTPSRKGAR